MRLWEKSTMTKPNASSTTSPPTLSPGDNVTVAVCLCYLCVVMLNTIYLTWETLTCRRTTWAEEKKMNMETFGVPGRFLRARGFRGRGRRGPSAAEQRPLPKDVSGRVWGCFFMLTFSVDIVVFYLFKKKSTSCFFSPNLKWKHFFFPQSQIYEVLCEMGEQFLLIKQLYARSKFINLQLAWWNAMWNFVFQPASRHINEVLLFAEYILSEDFFFFFSLPCKMETVEDFNSCY